MRTITRALPQIPSGAARWRRLLLSGGATAQRPSGGVAKLPQWTEPGAACGARLTSIGAGGGDDDCEDDALSPTPPETRNGGGRNRFFFSCFSLIFATEGTGERARKKSVRTEHFPRRGTTRGVNFPQVSISGDQKGAHACENGTLLRRPTFTQNNIRLPRRGAPSHFRGPQVLRMLMPASVQGASSGLYRVVRALRVVEWHHERAPLRTFSSSTPPS